MGARFVEMNGVKIAYGVRGEGPPLVLVMGYRLSSMAWPPTLIERLARCFMVITFDNRGTGLSDKPVKGYAIANMAQDIRGVIDDLKLAQVHMLGYSMGGAIAQEFVRQFPERVSSLILCATMAGGPHAKYASASVVAVMRDLDGLSPEQAARRIWKVTYSPGYLERHRDLAEEQMRREVALPTPLHAADLQFQAFAEFDGSTALANFRCPTLILTGDLDELIPPENAVMMAKVIPAAKLVVLRGYGHRVLWEDTQRCVEVITGFLDAARGAQVAIHDDLRGNQRYVPTASDTPISAMELLATWPLTLMNAVFESIAVARQSLLVGSASRFGDGKPIILVPQLFGTHLTLFPVSIWLKALGYRPVTVDPLPNFEGSSGDSSLSRVIHEVTRRVGRKGILITHSFGMLRVLRTAEMHRERISDVVVVGASRGPGIEGVRTHFISAWSALQPMLELPQLLRGIDLELIEAADLSSCEAGSAVNWAQTTDVEKPGCVGGSR
jgi:pimeloyl-ACP methyl ester carboxylesterase